MRLPFKTKERIIAEQITFLIKFQIEDMGSIIRHVHSMGLILFEGINCIDIFSTTSLKHKGMDIKYDFIQERENHCYLLPFNIIQLSK